MDRMTRQVAAPAARTPQINTEHIISLPERKVETDNYVFLVTHPLAASKGLDLHVVYLSTAGLIQNRQC